jgi:site-specific recombinase XerD
VADGGLRLVQGVLPGVAGSRPSPEAYQAACIEAWAASQVARNYSPATVDKATGILERILELCGRPAWEVTCEDLDRVVGSFASAGLSASTRRGYVSVFKGFFGFLAARKQAEIQAWFGVRLADPVDEFNAARHVGNDSPGVAPPPTHERMDAFFGFLRERLATCRKFAPAARDYALVRTLYHAGLRAEEAVSLEVADLHFTRGPFGKLHVRYGKAARGSGPRPRWVPMLDQLDLVLRWYVTDVRPRFGEGRRCSATRAAAGCTRAASATGSPTCSSWRAGRRPRASPPMGCVMPARPATTSAGWTWWRSSSCWATGTSAPPCGT